MDGALTKAVSSLDMIVHFQPRRYSVTLYFQDGSQVTSNDMWAYDAADAVTQVSIHYDQSTITGRDVEPRPTT